MPAGDESGVFGARLRDLLKQKLQDKPANVVELQEALTAAGYSVSTQYLYSLVNGRRRNPGLPLIEAIARVFDRPPQYFLTSTSSAFAEEADDADTTAAVKAVRDDPRIRVLAIQGRGLSPDAQDEVLRLVGLLLRAESGGPTTGRDES